MHDIWQTAFYSDIEQQPLATVSPTNSKERVVAANVVLSDARFLREQLAIECMEANKALSQAILDVISYSEKVESGNRVLALADCCIGRIRSRMRGHGIPIHAPSNSSLPNAAMISDINGNIIQGQLNCSHSFGEHFLTEFQMRLLKRHEILPK